MMTNQEAVKTLKANYPDACYEQLREAVNIAISALQAQDVPNTNVNDTISKQAAIDALKKISFSHWFEFGEYPSEDTREIEIINSNKAFEAIETLPSAQSEPHWIPVSERLPEKPNMYTVTDSKGDVVRFVFDNTESSREYWLRCAKAWMPLPEPFKEVTE